MSKKLCEGVPVVVDRYEDYFPQEADEGDYQEFLKYPGDALGMWLGVGASVTQRVAALSKQRARAAKPRR